MPENPFLPEPVPELPEVDPETWVLKPVIQTWVVTGIRCKDGQPQFAAGPDPVPDGTMAYLSLPDGSGGDERADDIWLAQPEVALAPVVPPVSPHHVPTTFQVESPGDLDHPGRVAWTCSCGLVNQTSTEYGRGELVCKQVNRVVDTVGDYKADLLADLRTLRTAKDGDNQHAQVIALDLAIRLVETGDWRAPEPGEMRECIACTHYHLCHNEGSGWTCDTCKRGLICHG